LAKRLKSQRREAIILAWQIGAFVGMSKPRPIAEILRKFDGPEKREPMNDDEIEHAMRLWAAAVNPRFGAT
jgi:hypothetical protein